MTEPTLDNVKKILIEVFPTISAYANVYEDKGRLEESYSCSRIDDWDREDTAEDIAYRFVDGTVRRAIVDRKHVSNELLLKMKAEYAQIPLGVRHYFSEEETEEFDKLVKRFPEAKSNYELFPI